MPNRQIILFSAMSIDGFIAKKDGGLDWLFEFDKAPKEKEETNAVFGEFYATIDTTIMGRKTYDQICREGHPDPYPEKDNYVISKGKNEESDFVKYITGGLEEFIADQKNRPGKPIWLVGGGILNTYFLMNDHIDVMILDLIPVVLGNGIKLFEENHANIHTKMQLDKVTEYPSGRVQLIYSRQ